MPDFSTQPRSDRAVIRISGDTALAFLHNLLTCDVLQMQSGHGAYGALLTPQGKILHDVFIVPGVEEVWLDCAAQQAAALLQKLLMYRLRAKLDIALDQSKAVAVSMRNDLEGLAYVDPRTPLMGFRAIVEQNNRGNDETAGDYDAARLALGLADSLADIGSGELFVFEANLDQLNGVNFHKGCYVGQEVVSRIHHRGLARNRILPVNFEGEAKYGTDVVSGGIRLGQMLSSLDGQGLALLRLDKLAEATGAVLTAEGVRLHVKKPIWANFDITIPEAAR